MDTRPPDSSAGNHRAGSYHASQLSTFSTGPEPEGRDQVPERDFKHLAGALRPEVAEAAQTKNPRQQDGDSCLNKSLATYNRRHLEHSDQCKAPPAGTMLVSGCGGGGTEIPAKGHPEVRSRQWTSDTTTVAQPRTPW